MNKEDNNFDFQEALKAIQAGKPLLDNMSALYADVLPEQNQSLANAILD